MRLIEHRTDAKRSHVFTDSGLHIGTALFFEPGNVRLFHQAMFDGLVVPMATDYRDREEMRRAVDSDA